MSFSAVLKHFEEPFDIERPSTVVRVRGRVVEGTPPQKLPGRGSITPASPRDLQRLPEGSRSNAAIAIITDCELQTAAIPGTNPDIVIPCGNVFPGVRFEVQSVEPWPNSRKYIAIKAGQ